MSNGKARRQFPAKLLLNKRNVKRNETGHQKPHLIYIQYELKTESEQAERVSHLCRPRNESRNMVCKVGVLRGNNVTLQSKPTTTTTFKTKN